MAIAIIGGETRKFVPLVHLYREALQRGEFDPAVVPISINSHGYIADTMEQAIDESFPAHKIMMDRIGRERGWPELTRQQFAAGASLGGALVAGSPWDIAEKILYQHQLFGHDRFMLQISVGTMPHERVLRSIELLGTQVVPLVREGFSRLRETADLNDRASLTGPEDAPAPGLIRCAA